MLLDLCFAIVCAATASASFVKIPRAAALRDSPSGTYAPTRGQCGELQVRRTSDEQRLNVDEAAYIRSKAVNSGPAWDEYLTSVGLADFDVASFVARAPQGDMPNAAFTISGGGQRAMLVGGSVLAGMDNRNTSAVAAKTGGVVQLANYVVGLSGGSWITGSWAMTGYPQLQRLRDEVWNMQESFSAPKEDNPSLFTSTLTALLQKMGAGFPVSFNDFFGRQLAYHLVNDTRSPLDINQEGSASLWSQIRETEDFQAGVVPFAIIVALGRQQGEINLTIASPIYEFTPFEFGTNVPGLSPGAYIPVEALGTTMLNGTPDQSTCVTGFDNAAFIMATSGQFFGSPSALALGAAGNGLSDSIAITGILGVVPDASIIAAVIPSPFQGLSPTTFPAGSESELNLVDGGYAGENLPFWPLLGATRDIDVIVAIDASNDFEQFPDGSATRTTYEKSLQLGYEAFPFPYFPTNDVFVAQGLNKRPSFFGSICTSITPSTPLIVYIPNYNINFATNTSIFAPLYSNEDQEGFFNNGFAVATQNQTEGGGWSSCLACALIDSQVARNGETRTTECEACFTEYCYLGTSDLSN